MKNILIWLSYGKSHQGSFWDTVYGVVNMLSVIILMILFSYFTSVIFISSVFHFQQEY